MNVWIAMHLANAEKMVAVLKEFEFDVPNYRLLRLGECEGAIPAPQPRQRRPLTQLEE